MQGVGNPRFNSDCIVLKDKSPASLELLRLRAHEIAGVLVNPISGMGWGNSTTATLGHPTVNAGPEAIESFRKWLCQVRETCTACSVPLIFDETWAFQLGPGGAQELYGVTADIVTLGKALGGGHAVGAVCGPHRLMERRDPARPMLVSFVVGTFKASPMVMGSMNAVLTWVTTPEAVAEFNESKDRIAKWVATCNAALSEQGLPISIAAFRNMWTVRYHQRSAYQFLFQYYLRYAGLQMVWVGTGKMLLNLEFKEKDLDKLTGILVSAAKKFKADGWWWEGSQPVNLANLAIVPTLRYHWGCIKSALGLGS
jgi:glutamate-1-semialdehyde 2,1-aminomutase